MNRPGPLARGATAHAPIIAEASALLATDPARAGALARTVLQSTPDDPRALLILASARRRQGDPAGALNLLEPLAKAWPRAAHTQYELGLARAARGDTAAAISSLRNAVTLNRDLADAWRALGDLLFKAGEVDAARAAFAEQERAAVRDPALKPAAEAIFQGRLDDADRLLRARLMASPNHPEALRMLAETLVRRGRHAEAEPLLAHCLRLDPAYDGARFTWADTLFRLQRGAAALAQIEPLLARDPAHPAYRNLAAACLALVGDYDRAIALYESLLAEFPGQPNIWLNYGHALGTTRRREDTIAAYRRCISLAPGLGEAYWSLANLKSVSFTPGEREAMAALLDRGNLDNGDRLHLHYALGKALEDAGEDRDAFEHYAAGARLRRAEAPYDAGETTRRARRSMAFFTRSLFEELGAAGSGSKAPIFIVGLPRSGSTLVEQILASHSAVEGTQELPDIGFIAAELDQPQNAYPERLAAVSKAQLAALGETYLERTRVQRRLGRPFFIDKMPNNFHHLGLIHLILPGAKIIDARRHPMGAGFSAFKQHFAQGQSFSYDLTDLGLYYRDYVDVMAHFDAVLPGRVHRVIYEDLVEDTETEVRRLLDYCDLPFEAACLRFYENDRAVRTVSSEQVRRPIFRDGLDQWRRFEPWLGPLKSALGPALETWRG